MKSLPAAAMLVAITLAAPGCGGGYPGSRPQAPVSTASVPQRTSSVSAGTISSTGLILDGSVRCTASVSSFVEAGSRLGLTFTVRNVSDHPVKVALAG